MKFYFALFLVVLAGLPTQVMAACDPLIDSDGDGVNDCSDYCPSDPNTSDPTGCECGQIEIDFNQDGLSECFDQCVEDRSRSDFGYCECPLFDALKSYLGFEFPCPNQTLKPGTTIDQPPGVVVSRDAASGESVVTFFFEKFSGARLKAATLRAVLSEPTADAAQRSATVKLARRYQLVVTPAAAGAEVIKKTAKRNELSLRNLAPGDYAAKYRGMGVDSNNRVRFRTKFSPVKTFTVPQ